MGDFPQGENAASKGKLHATGTEIAILINRLHECDPLSTPGSGAGSEGTHK
jgi:hypothetical protein